MITKSKRSIANHEIQTQTIPDSKTKKSTHHIELRNGWPHGKVLDTLSDSLVTENIDRMEVNVVGLQYLAGSIRESTLREKLRPLHKKQDGVVVNKALDTFLGVLGGFLAKVVEGHVGRGGGGGSGSNEASSGGWCESRSSSNQRTGDESKEERRSGSNHFESFVVV